ncbi:MAG: hypothetical protein R2795_18550 [Saprospiraceae bacterium]
MSGIRERRPWRTPASAPASATIYTVTVTDGNNCRQIDQATVNVYCQCHTMPVYVLAISYRQCAIPGWRSAYSWSPGGLTYRVQIVPNRWRTRLRLLLTL